jgi:non-heme chloroperoxidase
MPYFAVGKENSSDINLYYEDLGGGQPVVLIHGFPLNGQSWEKQTSALIDAGYRVITYDRRGFGKSDQPSSGYDYDTFTEDLNHLITKLDLRDAVLIGFSMGTGEVTRYLSTYGSERISKAVLVGAIPPFLLKTDDNPEGVDKQVFDGIKTAIVQDRPSFFTAFFKDFYNVDKLSGNLIFGENRITEDAVKMSWNVAVQASAIATLKCVDTWLTDFRADLPKIDVPILIIHGDADRTLPFEATAKRLPSLIKNSRLVVVENGPHAIPWTHADKVTPEILKFLGEKSESSKSKEA